jgi:hypothetical protein
MSISGVSSPNPVNVAYQTQPAHQAPAKPSHNQPTETTPQEDKVQLSSAAKSASGDVDHDGDRH